MVALERNKQFNTRISGYIGWQQAARKLDPDAAPAPRTMSISPRMVLEEREQRPLRRPSTMLLWRMLRVPTSKATRDTLVEYS